MNKRAKVQIISEFFLDTVCLTAANLISYLIFFFGFHKIPLFPSSEWVRFIVTLFVSYLIVFVGFHSNVDIRQRGRLREFISILKNATLTYLFLAMLLLLLKNRIAESRYLFISGFLLFVVFSSGSRYLFKRWITGYFSNSRVASIVGVITTADRAEEFIGELQRDWSQHISGVVVIDDYQPISRRALPLAAQAVAGNAVTASATAYKKTIFDIPVIDYDNGNYMQWIRSAPLDEVYVNLPYEKPTEVQELVEELEDMGITVHLNIPSLETMLEESKFDNINCKTYAGYPMASFTAKQLDNRWMIAKRVCDVVFGGLGCLFSLPIIGVIAIPLLRESPGPLIFKQQRVGRNGRIFNIYKIRSMYVDAEEHKEQLLAQNDMDGLMFKLEDDPRVTKVGKFIRTYSLDELPQFFNVVKGDMSLIGTRPPTVEEFWQYESRHKRRLSMRPGISGMWQVSGRSDIHNFEEVVKLDCQYIDEWSPMLDIKIFFKTIRVVLTHKGAK